VAQIRIAKNSLQQTKFNRRSARQTFVERCGQCASALPGRGKAKMTAKEMAARINGREYQNETTKEDCELAKQSGLVIAYGASDDLLELEGAVVDELGAWDGTERYINVDEATVFNKDGEDYCEKCFVRMNKIKIVARWCPPALNTSWLVITDNLFEPFDIMENGELYCRGCVFELKTIERQIAMDAALKVNVPLCSSCGMDDKMIHSDLWTCSRCGLSQ
jgi:hypothetical protein